MIRLSHDERNSSPMAMFFSQMTELPAVMRNRCPSESVPPFFTSSRVPLPMVALPEKCKLPVMASVVAVFFFLSYLPWMIIDIKKKKKLAAAPAPAEEASAEQTEA